MFSSKNKNNIIPPVNTSVSSEDVYVMPEKFHPHSSPPSSNKTLAIVSVILFLILISTGTYFIYGAWQKNQAQTTKSDDQNIVTINQNANQNLNTTRNINVNTNTNTNDNSNINDNINNNSNENINTNTSPSIDQLVPPPASGDADRDGLTDLEEALIGTSASSPDSDVDGYLDSEEIINGYNPAVSSSSNNPYRLSEASFITELITNFSNNNFKTFYIKGWSISLIESLYEVRIITGTGEMIKISIIDNPDQVSAANWYLINHPQITLSQLGNVEFGNFKGVRAPNSLMVYLTDQTRNKIYAFEYDLDTSLEFRYPSMFEMIIRNFKLVDLAINNSPTATSTTP